MMTGRSILGVLVVGLCMTLAPATGWGQDGEKVDKGVQEPKDAKGAKDTKEAEEVNWDASELSSTKFGTLLTGPEGDLDMLRDNVVVVHFWHPEDSASTGALMALKKLYEGNHGGGLAVVANNSSGMRDRAHAVLKGLRPPFPVVSDLTLAPPAIFKGKEVTRKDGKQVLTIVYDHTGTARAYFPGFNGDARTCVARLLKLRPGPVLGAKTYRKIGQAVAMVRAEKYGPALKFCKEKADAAGADADTKAEAADLAKRLEDYAERITKQAGEKKEWRPSQAVKLLVDLQRQYAGSAPGDEAGKQVGEWKKDQGFQKSLQAEQDYLKVRTGLEGIPVRPDVAMDKRKWEAKYMRQVQELGRLVVTMKKKYGAENQHAVQAQGLITALGVE